MKSFPKRNQGFSLIEILLVIGIIAVLAIAAFLVFPSVQASSRANTEQSNIMTIAAGVKNLYNGRYADGATPASISNTTLNAARVFPSSMNGGKYGASGTIASSWGGNVTVASATPWSNFTITYVGVPTAVCLKLIPGLIQNFESVKIGSATALTPSTSSPATIVSQCNAAATQDVVITSN